jgi:hypothetical protein
MRTIGFEDHFSGVWAGITYGGSLVFSVIVAGLAPRPRRASMLFALAFPFVMSGLILGIFVWLVRSGL